MIQYKYKNLPGQRQGVQSRAYINRVHEELDDAVGLYRANRAAKLRLDSHGSWEGSLHELEDNNVHEEMCRTLEYLLWKAWWWRERASSHSGMGSDMLEGLSSYVACQAAVYTRLHDSFKALWETPLLEEPEELKRDEEEGAERLEDEMGSEASDNEGGQGGDSSSSNEDASS